MRAPRVAARAAAPVFPAAEPEPSNTAGCPQAAALERIAGVLEALNAPAPDGGDSVIARFARAADALADLGEAQKKLCAFLVKHRVKIVLSLLGGLMAVGAISPTAAEGLKEVLRTWGPL